MADTSQARVAAFHHQPPSMRVLRWLVVGVLCVHVPLASYSGYRAIVQVYDLTVRTSGTVLRPGTSVGFDVASSGRVTVDVELLLVQRARTETLAVKIVPTHGTPSYDPRTIRASAVVVLTPAMLAPFDAGPATVRAIANGRSQWLRTPPPKVRELSVDVAPH